ncbi:MAG: L-2-hydroxyglutarate oxidase [Ignavibacteriae bacterium]|nr:MAG: L-2-hydroxyglutarate oxidase [Ignavibacteriota bacterium]
MYDYTIIGAGIVGLATALMLLRKEPEAKIIILEKESELGKHQTGHNSGVIHSGIYYKPGSEKAKNCVKGYKLLLDFCRENEIEFDLCGKLIVAKNHEEEVELQNIYNCGCENGLANLKVLSGEQIKEKEPYCFGTKAVYVPQTGIIDFKAVLNKYAELIRKSNSEIVFNSEVKNIIEKNDYVEVIATNGNYSTKKIITCSGLQSDRIAKITNPNLGLKIIPFRGEYYKLNKTKEYLVNSLIYPVPDKSFPFLGVHFTKKINGEVEAGPNAVFSFAREGYSKFSFNFKDTIDTFTFSGFHKIVSKYWKTGFCEFYRSFNKTAFTNELKKILPKIKKAHLVKGGAGIRAQACGINGNLLDDFNFQKTKRILHVCNAPSPAATASLAIGEKITNMIIN